MKIDGAQFLNDLATAPDGTVYVSDSAALKIFEVRNGKASVFVEGGDVVEQPNGLLVDGTRLILGTIGPAPQPGAAPGRGRGATPPSGHLYAFDLKSKQRTTLHDAAGRRHRRHRARRQRRPAGDRRHRPAPAAGEQRRAT